MTDNVQLNNQLSQMINEFNKQRESGLICDTECQNSQNIRNWQHKVTEKEIIKPVIDSIYTLSDLSKAHLKVATGHGSGKVVIRNNL